jgi:uncharacterized membrane protein
MFEMLMAMSKWLETTWWGTGVRTSTWAYPFIQLIHFSGLSLWLGTIVTVDLRLLGAGKNRQTAAELSDSLFVWNWIGFCIVVLGGFLLFSATGRGYITNPAFQVKLGIFVPIALIWHIVVQQKVRTWGKTSDTPAVAKIAGLVELLLWVCVVTAAVLIPNY